MATVDASGQPHAIPIVYVYDGGRLYTPIDKKPKRVGDLYQLQRIRDIRAEPRVAVIIDEYSDDWEKLAWVQIRGRAGILETGRIYQTAVSLLVDKYPQYREMTLDGRPLIAITLERVVSWRAKE
jgi:PPOX class probable F420-dependent enzyme